MPKGLLIVESPTKEKTIGKMLGRDFVIKSSYGHIRDLPARELGVDVEHGFEPKYAELPKAKKILPELKKLAAAADVVYLATDYDREGEAIAWHLSKVLKLSKEKARRITFHEITTQAIKEAVAHPRELDMALVDAQVARRVLDRLVGYRLSPLLWKKVRRGLSAGRVQSVAVRLICAREEEIEAFKPEEYWTLDAILNKDGKEFSASLFGEGEKKFDKFAFRGKEALDKVLQKLEGAAYVVKSVEPKERRRSPAPPFTTASLQQDASRRLHFSASRTMVVAQQLYEGIEVEPGEGAVGLITYMRTDSVNVAKEAQDEAVAFIQKEYGQDHLPPKPRVYKAKNKRAQEAHEAVRPTKPSRSPESVKKFLEPDQFRLYELIWQRFMGSQMADAVYDTLTVDIDAAGYVFRANGHALKFPGYLAVYGEVAEEDKKEATEEDPKETKVLPPLAAGDKPGLKELHPGQHFTEPPPRFNEASLVKTLEEHGIGRPSTYAPIIHTIAERGYVRIEDRRFYPTDLGRTVDKQLLEHFPGIVSVDFTAGMEDKLDSIAEADADWKKVMADFYGPFEANLEKADKSMGKVEVRAQATDEKCPKCNSPMVLRENRFGRYLACTAYPNCKGAIPVDRNGQKIIPQETEEPCPKCGKKMVLKIRGRVRFLACPAYPECKTTFSVDKDGNKIMRPPPEATEYKCFKCGKMMWKRIGKRGPFLACSGFPRCRNIKPFPTPDKPYVAEGRAAQAQASAEESAAPKTAAPAAKAPARKKTKGKKKGESAG
jgi:DNA topoisomerase-1